MHRSLTKISDLSLKDIDEIMKLGREYINGKKSNILKQKIIINLFFESSTRTLSSFEIAAKDLGANVITIPVDSSSVSKGETIVDTVRTLNAMKPDFMIVRHRCSGIMATMAKSTKCSIINAGDGSYEHPTQALADYLVIKHFKSKIEGLKVAICGDVLHSRVARSNIRLLSRLGAKISIIGPLTLIYSNFPEVKSLHHSLKEGIKDIDVLMLLRVQKERMKEGAFIPSEQEYFHLYGLDEEKLSYAKQDMIIMHPGPVNRGKEISYQLANSNKVILKQVEFGLAIRKAVLHYFAAQDS
ncbi:MAG: aspartate carbamoyltransferase [Candidatus Mesenet longicola]|uniref:Aspartate carbamoyltransferase n=1 Tax=Candidatus Mesenet longicola TaxID=1892558 RepID=A0A8J3MQE7_9RICK|nr:MAG: aspartate carbamoyltransferase [Candidatus Mesenet longicola]GHM59472.1 MAG: aspartate carbamoyltransferase [Candidatus Mesenet longicola]